MEQDWTYGVWGGTFERTFFDIRVFNPHAPSNRTTLLSTCYKKHELIKKCAYEQRIQEVEHVTFTPLVLSATRGLTKEAYIFYKCLASMLAYKWDLIQQHTLLATLLFSLLTSSVLNSMYHRCQIKVWTCHQSSCCH